MGTAALAQSAAFMETLNNAKGREGRGEFVIASGMYKALSEANTPPVGPVPQELRNALARRSVACVVADVNRKLAKNPQVDDVTYVLLQQSYENMRALEPRNATWPYLIATTWAAQGRYVEADRALKVAMTLQGPAKEPAQRMHNVIASYAKKDLARLNAMDRAAMQAAVAAAAMMRGFSKSEKYEPNYGDAAGGNRARAAGDAGAAARFSSGDATSGDRFKYGY